MGTQGTGRKRSTKKERSTAEDDALNLIAREAEARLAAKRAARAEAREIRMKELERQQKEIFQVQKKYYGLDTKLDDRADGKWGDIEQWMEDSERYSRSSRIQTLSDDDERMSVGSRGSVRSDLDAVGAYGGGDSSSLKKSKKKKKHKHKDKDRNGYDDDYSVISSRSSRLSDESRVSRSSRLDLTSSRLSEDPRGSRASRLDLQPASYASSDLYSFNGLSSSRNPGSTFNGFQFCRSLSHITQQLHRRSSLYEDSLCSGSRRVTSSSSIPLEYTSYRSSGSRASSRASSARASPVDNCGSVASFLRSTASSSGLPRDLDDVTIPDFSDVSRFAPAGGRGCDVEDRDYLEKGSRAASALTAATLTSLGGTSSRRGSGETALTVDAETSIREIKDALVEVEEKYRKAMVSNAQLDNEKNNLMYQVDTLKDSLMELEELLAESRRGFEEKVKEYEREKHAHTVLQFQFNEMKETLKQSEELLNKHGIVLGPDLNINGEAAEAPVDGLPSADSASTPAKDSPASPPEGNSMLGNTEERLGSSGEEEVNPEQHQEMYTGAKDNHLNSDTLSNVAGASTLETFSQEQPTEEQQTCLEDKKTATEEDNVEEQGLSNDFSVDINVQSLTEAKDIIVCSPGLQNIVISSENAPETETPEGGDVGETVKPDSGDTETKSSSVNIQSNDTRESCSNLSEKQENEQEDEESNLRNTESCLQQKVARDVVRESSPDESFPTSSSAEPQQEPDKAGEAENDETEEISSKSQPQGTAASGKKKKRKKRGKKKGGAQEDKNQQKDETDKEKGKTEIDTESATKDDGPTTEPFDGSVTATLKELKVEQVKKEKVSQETEEVDGIEAVKPTETFSPNETVKESRMDHDTDEQDKEQLLETKNVEKSETFSFSETPKELSADHGMDEHNKDQTLEMENAEKAETVTKTETFSHIETPKEVSMDHVTDEQNKEQSLETETVEAAEAVEAGEAAAHTETLSEVETLTESRTTPRKDEQDKEKTLETEKVEEVESRTSPIPETSFGTPDLIDNSKGAESTDGSEEECTSSVDNSKSETDISTNVIHSESENCLIVSAEEEVGSINDAENSFETSHKENTEAESHVPSNGDIAAAESEYTNNSDIKDNKSISQSSPDGFTDVLKSLSGSEPSSDLFEAVNLNSDDTLVKFSNEGPKKATETVRDGEDPGAEAKQDSLSPSILSPKPDGDESKLKADETEKELKRGTSEPEGLVETESSHDVKSVSCDNASLMKKSDPFDFVQSLLQTEVQATHLDDAEGQTLRHEDQMPESNAVSKVSSETKEDIDMLNTPNSPKETSEIRPAVKHDHSAEDPEPNSSKNEQQSQTKQLHESSIDKSDYNDSSQLTLQDSEEEDIDEGLSFDFDDMDIEAAVAASLPENQNQEEVEEGVEVMSVESNSGSSGLCQSNTESSENRQHEPVESNEEKHEDAGGTPVDKLDTTSRDNQNSSAHEDALSDKNEHAENMSEKQKQMPEEEVSVAEEPEHIIEEGKVLNVGELAVVAEDVNQVISVPAEEGLDAVMHDLQGEHLDLPKSAEQVASNKEPQQTEKDVKKNGKKGKGKGKEECKMS
ncbi:uro-adherence factor A isoform X12 [Plectropomus leopardus]|uniref:uro-adherence factor A isoform X12 n=1 Tax=Plectropomus leopardus TaxID=160734 RepID=UPI001C4B68DB|nr:uro-adherence factor A isoform X12 [Plectropomus leopardus]